METWTIDLLFLEIGHGNTLHMAIFCGQRLWNVPEHDILGSHNTRHPIRVDGDGPCYIYATTAGQESRTSDYFILFRQRVTCIYMHRYVRRDYQSTTESILPVHVHLGLCRDDTSDQISPFLNPHPEQKNPPCHQTKSSPAHQQPAACAAQSTPARRPAQSQKSPACKHT